MRHILQDVIGAQWRSGCGAPDTPLIIYLACVYLCWTRLSEGGSREGKAGALLPARVRAAQNSGGTAGFVETRVLVYGRARLGDRGGNNAANRGYGLSCTQTHNLIDIKKQSILGAIVSNVLNVNGTLRGHWLLC